LNMARWSMKDQSSPGSASDLNRREFLRSAAVAGAGLMVTWPGWAQEQAGASTKADELRVAFIGPGSQGRNLLTQCLKIPGIRFTAICDIWPYHQEYAANILKKYDQIVKVYTDYQELLAQEQDLDAAIVATPDWVHAEQAIACLKAGLHVYCEKEMANTLDSARKMVQAARDTKKLLQIGHQRRSNPRYWHALKMINNDKILGRITHIGGQWNRSQRFDLGWPEGKELAAAALKKYGYDTMDRFRNWRWYKQYSGGPMADLGSHQVDVFNWFLAAPPAGVLATGGLDNYEDREWYDNVLALYEYKVDGKNVRGSYEVLNTTSYGGFFETFMGNEGSLMISEDSRKGFIFREQEAKHREWEDEASKVETMGRDAIELKIGETLRPDGTKDPEGQRLLEESQKPPHQLHLENFFNAIRNGTPLSCPPEVAYETAVSVLKANEAVEKGCRIEFKPEEFKV
jgi:predicted dehydrogenase